jgi:hypothetical protein
MNNSKGMAFLINIDKHDDTCQLASALITSGDILVISGFVGVMHAEIGMAILRAVEQSPMQIHIVSNSSDRYIVALTSGKIDIEKLWPLINTGIAESAGMAVLQALEEAIYVSEDFDDDLGPTRK